MSLNLRKWLAPHRQDETRHVKLFCIIVASVFISACSTTGNKDQDSGPSKPVDWSQVKPVVPKKEPKSAYGNPETYEVYGVTYRTLKSSNRFKQKGVASWYGTKFHGRRTSSGEPYDMLQLTAAHKTLPIPCYVKVTNHDNGRQLVVRVNDRGPFVKSRIIDLSYAAAHKLGMAEKGTANVSIETIDFDANGPDLQNGAKPVQKSAATEKTVLPINKDKNRDHKRFVQVGAYSNHKSAQKLAKVLDKEIDLPISVLPIKRQGKKLFRVRIGPIVSLAVAEALAKTLNITELGKPSIVYQD
jgi:rare lipoprotein A